MNVGIARLSALRYARLAWYCAPALLMLPTDLRAAQPASVVSFSGQLHGTTATFPARLAVFASCADRPRIFGEVVQQRYRIELPTGTRCRAID